MSKGPDFLVIGAQKCGTTWLHRGLQQHPQVRVPPAKDGGFFCYEATRGAEAFAAYASQFRLENRERIAGESTAAYFWTPTRSQWDHKPAGFEHDIPERVRHTLGASPRLVLCLRDPVERAVSAWVHHVVQGELSPDTHILDVGHHLGIVDMGFYARHLRNWLRAFPPESFLVLILEDDISRAPLSTLRKVYRFLGVRENVVLPQASDAVYAGPHRERTGHGTRVTLKGRQTRVAGPQTRARLAEIYREDVADLADLIRRDVARIWGYT